MAGKGADGMDAKATGGLIARRRKEKNWSQGELTERLHVTDKAVSRWETGRGLPDENPWRLVSHKTKIPSVQQRRGFLQQGYTPRIEFRRNSDPFSAGHAPAENTLIRAPWAHTSPQTGGRVVRRGARSPLRTSRLLAGASHRARWRSHASPAPCPCKRRASPPPSGR